MKAKITILGLSFILLTSSIKISNANWIEKNNITEIVSNSESIGYTSTTSYFKYLFNDLKDENGYDIFDNSIAQDTIIFTGQGEDYYFGFSVSTAGDVNGDGYSDVIIGAYNANTAYIYYGGTNIDDIADVTLSGTNQFGESVSTAGDVNGDGYSDIIVGARRSGTENTGSAYIYYGGINMNNVADVVMSGEAVNNNFGLPVSSAGDINGDGYSDVIVGAYGYNGSRGRVYVFYGATNMNNVPDVIMTGENANDYFNNCSTAGDVNGDGYSDVIVGAWGYNTQTGKAYIFYGGVSMNNVADVVMTGEGILNEFGLSVNNAGDVNGDSYADVIIGAPKCDSIRGKTYIYYGGAIINDVADVIMTGESTNNYFGYSVSTAEDVNKDGYSDVIVGAWGYNKTYIYYGGTNMDNTSDKTMTGNTPENYGFSVSTAGDVNGDSYLDCIIGAYGYNNNMGRAYLFLNMITKPELLIPINNSINNPTTINFKWKKVSNALYYILNVSPDSTFNSILIADTISIDTSKTVSGFLYGSQYFWRVVAKDSSGTEYTSERWKFTTKSRPEPDLVNPVNNSIDNPLNLNFNWMKVSNANFYRLLVSTDSLFNSSVFIDSVLTDTSLFVYGLAYQTKYYCKVGVKDSTGLTYFTEVFNFTTLTRPNVEMIYPPNDSINIPLNINFTWKSVSYAFSYRIQVASDSAFNNLIYYYTGITDTFKTINGFSHLTKYYWRVGAKDILGTTYYPSDYNFTVMPPINLNLKVAMEAMYYPLFNQLSRRDTLTVYLRDVTAPFTIRDSAKGVIDSLTLTTQLIFSKASSGLYYIVVKHFNSIETWSKSGGESLPPDGTVYNFDFTPSASQAYGNNLKLKGGKYCIYSGDINFNGVIDGADAVRVHTDSYNFITGYYLPTDLNGDNFVDGIDYSIVDNNAYNFVATVSPLP